MSADARMSSGELQSSVKGALRKRDSENRNEDYWPETENENILQTVLDR